MRSHAACFLWPLMCLAVLAACARAETLDEVTNPRHASRTWVSDMAGVIDEGDRARLNQVIGDLERTASAEMAVATVRSTGGQTPKGFATALYNKWGIGKKGKDNGVLVLLVMDARRVEVETGYGAEGVLPDGKVGGILDTRIIPRFREGDFGGGLVAGVETMAAALSGKAASPAPRGQTGTSTPGRPAGVPAPSAPVRPGGAPAPYAPMRPGGMPMPDAPAGGSGMPPAAWLAILLALPLAIYGIWRSRIRHCPQCRQRMRKLTEDQEDAYLSFDQKVEDDLGAVAHHVWRCDACQLHKVERGWRSWSYEDCPKCAHHTVQRHTSTLRSPTYESEGLREVQRECRFPKCSFRRTDHERIPRKVRSTTSSGGWSSRSGGGGWSSGGGGGSFGGGSSGGGGAGRSW